MPKRLVLFGATFFFLNYLSAQALDSLVLMNGKSVVGKITFENKNNIFIDNYSTKNKETIPVSQVSKRIPVYKTESVTHKVKPTFGVGIKYSPPVGLLKPNGISSNLTLISAEHTVVFPILRSEKVFFQVNQFIEYASYLRETYGGHFTGFQQEKMSTISLGIPLMINYVSGGIKRILLGFGGSPVVAIGDEVTLQARFIGAAGYVIRSGSKSQLRTMLCIQNFRVNKFYPDESTQSLIVGVNLAYMFL